MSGKLLLEYIQRRNNEVDTWIAKAAEQFVVENVTNPGFGRHLQLAVEELYELGQGKDVCYDRPAFGPAYALWYQGRRLNQALAALAQPFAEARSRQIDVFDLGAGTGAVMTAMALLRWAALEQEGSAPTVRLVNIDSSPFMLDYTKNWFFREDLQPDWLAPALNGLKAEFDVCAWQNSESPANAGACWICASYLFDSGERVEDLFDPFRKKIETWQPDLLWLGTSAKKASKLKKFLESLDDLAHLQRTSVPNAPFSGKMNEVNKMRTRLKEKGMARTDGKAQWHEPDSPVPTLYRSSTPMLALREKRPENKSELSIYNAPIRIRRDVILTPDQVKAAKYTERPRLIYGPAGCGKSLVITEAVKNIIIHHNRASGPDPLRILVTTFNKKLVFLLKNWLTELLDTKPKWNDPSTDYTFDLYHAEVRLMNFDKLPIRLGHIQGEVKENREWHLGLIDSLVPQARKKFPRVTEEPFTKADYILDEFHRVVYAQRITERETYINANRVGRGEHTLPSGGPTRAFLWDVMDRYHLELRNRNVDSFITKRWKFLDQFSQSRKPVQAYRYVFVDELQDCTQADFEIFYRLLSDPNGLTAAGDLAQAVHLGTSAASPRERTERSQANFERHFLPGSYRLPYWICRAIHPFSRGVVEKHTTANKGEESTASELDAWKGAPPGARPIVVYGDDSEALAERIREIVHTYQPYAGNRPDKSDTDGNSTTEAESITILEQDVGLAEALKERHKEKVSAFSILRLKGLEKRMVVWSTSAPPPSAYEVDEIVYTILTRTSCLLIIALSDDIRPEFYPILKQLDQTYLIFHDEAAEKAFERAR